MCFRRKFLVSMMIFALIGVIVVTSHSIPPSGTENVTGEDNTLTSPKSSQIPLISPSDWDARSDASSVNGNAHRDCCLPNWFPKQTIGTIGVLVIVLFIVISIFKHEPKNIPNYNFNQSGYFQKNNSFFGGIGDRNASIWRNFNQNNTTQLETQNNNNFLPIFVFLIIGLLMLAMMHFYAWYFYRTIIRSWLNSSDSYSYCGNIFDCIRKYRHSKNRKNKRTKPDSYVTDYDRKRVLNDFHSEKEPSLFQVLGQKRIEQDRKEREWREQYKAYWQQEVRRKSKEKLKVAEEKPNRNNNNGEEEGLRLGSRNKSVKSLLRAQSKQQRSQMMSDIQSSLILSNIKTRKTRSFSREERRASKVLSSRIQSTLEQNPESKLNLPKSDARHSDNSLIQLRQKWPGSKTRKAIPESMNDETINWKMFDLNKNKSNLDIGGNVSYSNIDTSVDSNHLKNVGKHDKHRTSAASRKGQKVTPKPKQS